jgi:hypothetical protein
MYFKVVSYHNILNAYRMADFRLEIEQEVILSLFEFFTNISSGMQYGIKPSSNQYYGALLKNSSSFVQTSENFRLNADQSPLGFAPVVNEKSKKTAPLPSIIPIGAPWQEIYLLARTQKKIYIELFELAPIKLTLRSIAHSYIFFLTTVLVMYALYI